MFEKNVCVFHCIFTSILTFQFNFIIAQENGYLLLFPFYFILILRIPHTFGLFKNKLFFLTKILGNFMKISKPQNFMKIGTKWYSGILIMNLDSVF